MGANERLGFELYIDEKSNATNIITNLLASINQISAALKNMGVDNLTKSMEGLGKVAAGVQGAAQELKTWKSVQSETMKAASAEWKQYQKLVAEGATPTGEIKTWRSIQSEAMRAASAEWKEYQNKATAAVGAVDSVVDALSRKMTLQTIKAGGLNDAKKVDYSAYTQSALNPNWGANSHVEAYQKRQDAFLAAQIKNAEAQRLQDAKLEKAREDADAKAVAAAEKRLQRLQEIQGQRYLKNLDQSGMYLDNGQEKVKLDTIAKAFVENERRKQAAIRETLDLQIKAGESTLSTYQNAGMKPVNGGYVKKSAIVDPVQAESVARAEQLSKVMDSLTQKARSTKVSADEVSQAFAKAGVSLKDMDSRTYAKTNSELNKIGSSLKGITVEAKNAEGTLSILGVSLGGMATRLAEFYSMRTAIFAVTGQFREATAAAIDLNQGVHDILAISGESKDQFKAVSDSIYDIAKSSRFTTTEVTGLMQVLAQAGVASKDLGQVSAETGKFATATAADPKQAADLVTTAMNVYEIKSEQVTRVTNAMTAALNLSKLEASGLSTAFSYLAPQAAQLGMSMEQTLGIVANMAQSGIKPSTIGTGVSQMLKEFSAPKPRLRKMLEAYGIDEDSINPMKHDFADIVETLQKAKVSVSDLFAAMESRVGRSAVTAINLSAESFREMTANLTGTHAALVAYDKTMEGARARMNVVKQTFGELASTLGESLSPAFVGVTESLKGLLIVLGAGDGVVAKALIGVTALVGGIYSLTTAASVLRPIISSLFVAFTGAAPLLTITGIATGLGLLIPIIGGVLYAINSSNRAKEEEARLDLEKIDREERLGRVMQSVINGTTEETKKQSEAYHRYMTLVKSGKGTEEELNKLQNTRITLTTEQRVAISKYIEEGGPYSTYLRKLVEEGDNLRVIIELEKKRRSVGNEAILAKLPELNKRLRAAKTVNTGASEEDASGDLTGEAAASRARADSSAARVKKVKQDVSAELDKVGRVLTDARTGIDTHMIMLNKAGEYEAVPINTKKVNTERKTRPSSSGGGSSTHVSQASQQFDYEAAEIEALKAQLEHLKVKSKDLPTSVEEIQQNKEKALALLQAINDEEKKKADLKIHKTYQTWNAKANDGKGAWQVKKGFDSSITNDTVNSLIEASDTKLKTAKISLTKEYDDLIKAKTDVVEDYARAASKAEHDAIKKEQDALQKTYESVLKGKLEDERIILEAYNAERLSIKEEFDTKRLEAEEASEKALKDKLEKGNFKVGSKEYTQTQEGSLKTLSNTLRGINAEEQGAVVKALTLLSSAGNTNVTAVEKAADIALRSKQAALTLQRQQAWGGAALNSLDQEGVKAQIDAQEKKNAAYETFLRLQESIKAEGLHQIDIDTRIVDKVSTKKLYEQQHAQAVGDATEKLQAGKEVLDGYKVTLQEVANTEFTFSFLKGVQESWGKLDDFKGDTKALGSNVTNTAVEGLTGSIYAAFNTVANPDNNKIRELKASINDLREEKTTLQDDIASLEGNTYKTPQELTDLSEKKERLSAVTGELNAQTQALKEQQSAWSTFASGLKNTMKVILEQLQKYIIKMMAVALMQKVIGFGTSLVGSDSSSSGPLDLDTQGNSTGITLGGSTDYEKLLGFDGGGYIPLSAGTAGVDSVPAMLMPGEVVIKKSSVDYYGADKLLAINSQKIQKFAEGGLVGGSSAPSSNNKNGEAAEATLQIVNVIDPSSIPQTSAQQILNTISYEATKNGPTFRQLKTLIRA